MLRRKFSLTTFTTLTLMIGFIMIRFVVDAQTPVPNSDDLLVESVFPAWSACYDRIIWTDWSIVRITPDTGIPTDFADNSVIIFSEGDYLPDRTIAVDYHACVWLVADGDVTITSPFSDARSNKPVVSIKQSQWVSIHGLRIIGREDAPLRHQWVYVEESENVILSSMTTKWFTQWVHLNNAQAIIIDMLTSHANIQWLTAHEIDALTITDSLFFNNSIDGVHTSQTTNTDITSTVSFNNAHGIRLQDSALTTINYSYFYNNEFGATSYGTWPVGIYQSMIVNNSETWLFGDGQPVLIDTINKHNGLISNEDIVKTTIACKDMIYVQSPSPFFTNGNCNVVGQRTRSVNSYPIQLAHGNDYKQWLLQLARDEETATFIPTNKQRLIPEAGRTRSSYATNQVTLSRRDTNVSGIETYTYTITKLHDTETVIIQQPTTTTSVQVDLPDGVYKRSVWLQDASNEYLTEEQFFEVYTTPAFNGIDGSIQLSEINEGKALVILESSHDAYYRIYGDLAQEEYAGTIVAWERLVSSVEFATDEQSTQHDKLVYVEFFTDELQSAVIPLQVQYHATLLDRQDYYMLNKSVKQALDKLSLGKRCFMTGLLTQRAYDRSISSSNAEEKSSLAAMQHLLESYRLRHCE